MEVSTYSSYIFSGIILFNVIYALYTLGKMGRAQSSYDALTKIKIFTLSPYSIFLPQKLLDEVGGYKKHFFLIHVLFMITLFLAIFIQLKRFEVIVEFQENYIEQLKNQKNR